MENIVLPPTPDIEKVCDLLEIFIQRVLDAQVSFPGLGEYEASIEGLNLLYLVIRNVEALNVLARKDLVLYPSAMNITRSVFEITMKALWMLAPQDAFEREVRWLAQLQTEEEFYDRFSKRLVMLEVDNNDIVKTKNVYRKFRLDVAERLPKPYEPLPQIPDFASMLKAIGEEQKYLTYIFLSQYAHGTHVATGTYRKGLGNRKEHGEFITPNNWGVMFSIGWYCLAKISGRVFEIIGGNVNLFLKNDFIVEIQNLIKKIENS